MLLQMRLNNGIVPLDSIRGGKCKGRTDGLCSMDNFLASQYENAKLANYDFACFANYTLDTSKATDYDGAATNCTAGKFIEVVGDMSPVASANDFV